jgi:hypothetical protein
VTQAGLPAWEILQIVEFDECFSVAPLTPETTAV